MDEEKRIVLVVESDILIRSPLSEYLRECGYHVLEASGATEARQHVEAAATSIDVILADAAGDGGFALASWVRDAHPGVAVILAGSVDKAAEKAGDLCEQGPAIAKPYDHQLVLDRIRRMLASRDRA
ncbi:DNA-binding response OmpR family regulator [Sphingomonas kyeonggiensis]|uniref:response regulator n=1 Tax=Sphingomonas kyeonggiensis TaxID=1268553 RepID=UPI002785539B|nr:response regulator [Sphingomonas kyeonggiensis]MDQ0252460.1 DNA-binding response OmpR family regulator [Sphingomonas kyeonggiensis]